MERKTVTVHIDSLSNTERMLLHVLQNEIYIMSALIEVTRRDLALGPARQKLGVRIEASIGETNRVIDKLIPTEEKLKSS